MAEQQKLPKPETHHIWFTRKTYQTKLEIRFRNLPCCKVKLPPHIHHLLHKKQQPPIKPSKAEMLNAVRTCESLGCTKSNCTLKGTK